MWRSRGKPNKFALAKICERVTLKWPLAKWRVPEHMHFFRSRYLEPSRVSGLDQTDSNRTVFFPRHGGLDKLSSP